MKIINVVPIAKGFTNETFSYFTSKEVEAGGIVSVMVRRRSVLGIVIDAMDAKSAKIDLRNSPFALKSIRAVKAQSLFSAEFIASCKGVARHFAAPLGAVLRDFIPQVILDNAGDDLAPGNVSGGNGEPGLRIAPSVFCASRAERIQHYRGIIREEFARGRSVFFCIPTASEMEDFAEGLGKGIEKYTVSMHSLLTKKKVLAAWQFIKEEKHPILIVATKTFFSVPRRDIGAVIVDPESSPFFKMEARPYIDARRAAEIIASGWGARLIVGDSVVRAEALGAVAKFHLPRILTEAEQVVVDMTRKENAATGKKEEFKILSPQLAEVLKNAAEKGERSILFINRRGHTSTTVCNDCQRTILCGRCESPLVIHKTASSKKAKFVCHKCLTEKEAPEQCPYCGSWKLATLGTGSQKVVEEVENILPGAKIFRLDSDIAKTKKQGDDIAKNFYKAPGAVLVGTESLFSYVKNQVERVAVVSVDAAFTLPDFRVNEKVLQILLKLRSLAEKTFLIQTRMPELPLFDYALKGHISGFYEEELAQRKRFSYPPFKLLIKVTKGNADKPALQKEIKHFVEQLKDFDVVDYPAFIPKEKNLYKWNVIIKVDRETWPKGQAKLHSFLFYLPPAWRVDVEPDSLL